MAIGLRLALPLPAAVMASCAVVPEWRAPPVPQNFAFPVMVPPVLMFGGYAGLGDVDSDGGTISGLSGGIGGRMRDAIEMLFRFESGEFDGVGAPSSRDSISDGSQLHLDLGLRGFVPATDDLRAYFEGYVGYGFMDPDLASSEAIEGRSWSVGVGLEYVVSRWFSVATGLEYRDTEWRAESVDDFGRQSLSAQFQLILRLP